MVRITACFSGSSLIVLAAAATAVYAGAGSFDLDLKELDAARTVKKTAPKEPAAVSRKPQPATTPSSKVKRKEGAFVLYTIQPGDHLFKILVRDFSLTNAEAENLIPDILRDNGLSDIRRLKIGQIIRIPAVKGAPVTALSQADTAAVTVKKSVHKAVPIRRAEKSAEPERTPEVTGELKPQPVEADSPVSEGLAVMPLSAADTPRSEPAAAAIPATIPVGSLLAVSVTGNDPVTIFLGIAEALQLHLETNRIVQSSGASGFSIKVPLYAEAANGRKLIVTGQGSDPFQYTLFRLLEAEGYGIVQFTDTDRFRDVVSVSLAKLAVAAEYGRYRLSNNGERDVSGFLVETAGGRILLTDAPAGGIWSAEKLIVLPVSQPKE